MISWVEIVLVNYNGWEDTIECLESLLQQNYPAFSITIVDNASSDNSVRNILDWAKGNLNLPVTNLGQNYSNKPVPKPISITVLSEAETQNVRPPFPDTEDLKIITSEYNRGFAGGNNLATEFILAQYAAVDFIWYLNNDTVVHKNALSEMVKGFEEQVRNGVKLGIMGAKLMYYHNPNLIQAVGAKYNKWYATTNHLGCNEPDQGQYDDGTVSLFTDYIVGASMLVSREFLVNVGLMDPDFFLYFEELDWVLRGKRHGYTYSFCPQGIVYHKEGKSTGGNGKQVFKSYLADYYNIKNRIVITKRYFPLYRIPVYLSLMGVILNRIKRGQFSRVKMILAILFNSFFSARRK